MKEKQFVIIVYDISNDRRRTQLHKKLKNYGTPVQYSVFECNLDKDKLQEVKNMIKKVIKPRLDHVRFYLLCAACRKKIIIFGRHEITTEKDIFIV